MTRALPMLLAASAAAIAVAPTTAGALRLDSLRPVRAAQVSWPAGVVALSATAFLLAGVPACAAVLAGMVALARTAGGRRRTADAERERVRALDALSLLAADLRCGRDPAHALEAAAQIACGGSAMALAEAAAAARLGGDVVAALTVEGSAVSATLRALAACWQVCSEAGSGLAAAVERLEEGLRAAQAQRLAIAAELAGPRATAQLLAALPVVGMGLAAALGAHPLHVLLATPVGLGCLAAGVALDAAGVLWTQRLTERALP